MRRRAAIEPVTGPPQAGSPHAPQVFSGRDGDRINAVLAVAGYNFSLLLRWLEELLRALSLILGRPLGHPASPNQVPQNVLHGGPTTPKSKGESVSA
jgi:IS5 family transposase